MRPNAIASNLQSTYSLTREQSTSQLSSSSTNQNWSALRAKDWSCHCRSASIVRAFAKWRLIRWLPSKPAKILLLMIARARCRGICHTARKRQIYNFPPIEPTPPRYSSPSQSTSSPWITMVRSMIGRQKVRADFFLPKQPIKNLK